MAYSPAHIDVAPRIAEQDALAAEIQSATGCAADVAQFAAGSLIETPNAPLWGIVVSSHSPAGMIRARAAIVALRTFTTLGPARRDICATLLAQAAEARANADAAVDPFYRDWWPQREREAIRIAERWSA